MPFPYKTVLITGATAGIGRALAERMIADGVFVIAVGRRVERLNELVGKHGANKVAAEAFDVSDLDGLEAWAKKITATYPALDAIILNAGHQKTVDFTRPASVSRAGLTAEVQLNYLAPAHMTTLFLPHLLSVAGGGAQEGGAGPGRPAAVVFVTSGLAIVPIARCANYCATKAAAHSLAWTLRAQLEDVPNLRVIEIVPPAVQTELHELQPELVEIGQAHIGVPLDAYADETWASLRRDAGPAVIDEIHYSGAAKVFGDIEDAKRERFAFMAQQMKASSGRPNNRSSKA